MSDTNNNASNLPVMLGRIKIYPILDCVGHVPLGFFFQADQQKPMLEKLGLWAQLCEGSGVDPEVSKVPMRGFLIVTPSGDKILFDLGFGRSPFPATLEPRNLFLQNLEKTGISVQDIDHVMISHIHADHTGWTVTEDGKPTFPNATYMFMQDDVDHWRATEAGRQNVFYDERIAPLMDSPQLKLLPSEDCTFLEKEGVKMDILSLPGHTPGHLVLRVEDDTQELKTAANVAYFIGDALHFDSQVTCPTCSVNADVDAQLAATNRVKLLDWVERDNAIIVSAPSQGKRLRKSGPR